MVESAMSDFDWYRLFKPLHVRAAVALGGGFVLEGISGPLVARARTVQELRAYARLIYISENFLSIPAAFAIAIFGYATANKAGYNLDMTWLAAGQILFYLIVVLAIAFLRPAANRLYRLALAATDGPLSPELTEQIKK